MGRSPSIPVRLSGGSPQYVDPVYAANGKLKPLYAVVDRKPEHHSEGVHYLRYLENGNRVWESVGSDAPSALTARLQKEQTIGAKEAGANDSESLIPDRHGQNVVWGIVERFGVCLVILVALNLHSLGATDGIQNQLDARRDAQLVEDMKQVVSDRVLAQTKLAGYLSILQALGQETNNVFFSLG